MKFISKCYETQLTDTADRHPCRRSERRTHATMQARSPEPHWVGTRGNVPAACVDSAAQCTQPT